MAAQLGIRLKAMREFYGWSQRELAKRAGIPNSAISVIEQGTVSPSVMSLEKVLKGFPISLADFFAIDIARQKVELHLGQAGASAQKPAAGLQADLRSSGREIRMRLFSRCADDPPLNLIAQPKTRLLVTRGEGLFCSLSTSQLLRRGDSLSLYGTTPFRLQPAAGEIDWVLASPE